MGLLDLLNKFSGAISEVITGIKLLIAALFIRRSTKIEVKKNALEQENKIKDQQLEIAARPPASPGHVRDELFGPSEED